MGKPIGKSSDVISWLRELGCRYLPRGSLRHLLLLGAFWSLAGAIFSRSFTLVCSIIVARILGKAGFGQWGLILITISMFAHFASFGMALSATKHVAELRTTDPLRAGRTLSLILLTGLVSVSAMTLVCLGLARWLANNLYNVPELLVPLMLASIILLCMVLTQILQGALAGFEDFRCIAKINLVQGVVLFAIAPLLTLGLGLVGTVIGMAISQVTAMFLCIIATARKSRENNVPLGMEGIWRERSILWSYGLPSLLTAAAIGPTSVLSQAVVANIPGGLGDLGGFSVAMRWRETVLFIPGAVRRVTLPLLSKLKGANDYHRFVRALWANIGLNGGTALIAAIPIMILSPWILRLYGRNFTGDWDMMVILVGSGFFRAVNDVVTQVMPAMGKLWWNFGVHVVWGAVVLGGTLLMVPHYGARGYVWAVAVAEFNHMFLNCLLVIQVLKRAKSVNGTIF